MSGTRGQEWLARVRAGELLVFDGGYGTMLFAAGLANGACPELWNDTHADVVRSIHRAYFEAGSDLVETNTFGGARLKLNEYGLGDRTRELNERGARLVRETAPAHGYVAGSVGPTSRLPAEYEPLGDTTDEEYFETFREQAEALAEGGVDLFAVETMMFPQEASLRSAPAGRRGSRSWPRCSSSTRSSTTAIGRCGARAPPRSPRTSWPPAPMLSA